MAHDRQDAASAVRRIDADLDRLPRLGRGERGALPDDTADDQAVAALARLPANEVREGILVDGRAPEGRRQIGQRSFEGVHRDGFRRHLLLGEGQADAALGDQNGARPMAGLELGEVLGGLATDEKAASQTMDLDGRPVALVIEADQEGGYGDARFWRRHHGAHGGAKRPVLEMIGGPSETDVVRAAPSRRSAGSAAEGRSACGRDIVGQPARS